MSKHQHRLYHFIARVFRRDSGKKFKFAHRYSKRYFAKHTLLKVLLLFIAVILLLIGIILLFIPGPGLFFILLSLVILASLSITIAVLLDKIELRLKNFYHRLRHKKGT